MNTCYICQTPSIETILDFGPQPISNRFLKQPSSQEFLHRLQFGSCQSCGLSQLIDPAPIHQVKPLFDWIRYNEPEGHLDDVVKNLILLPEISPDSTFLGITEKDTSTLVRLNKKGFLKTSILDLKNDLGIDDSNAGLESIQEKVTVNFNRAISKNNESKKVILARHILEHAHNPLDFMEALKALAGQNGYVVFEVPDNTKVLTSYDYSILWEEHILYFTPQTLIATLKNSGFEIIFYKNYPYSMENSIVIIAKTNSNHKTFYYSKDIVKEEQKTHKNYGKNFPIRKKIICDILNKLKKKGPIALLGAGHLAIHFINLMELKNYIDFIVDDHPHKKNHYMPGSQLPILPTSELIEKNIKFCLMSVSQESEIKVMNSNKKFLDMGGEFYSIFPTSHYGFQKFL